ncbi:hypothetical protein BDQ17DRAFT_1360451 [Cyathus striatus]|nr:hypothetical protein BDQ17DRAFT_1360451 [Cyathus striatus]
MGQTFLTHQPTYLQTSIKMMPLHLHPSTTLTVSGKHLRRYGRGAKRYFNHVARSLKDLTHKDEYTDTYALVDEEDLDDSSSEFVPVFHGDGEESDSDSFVSLEDKDRRDDYIRYEEPCLLYEDRESAADGIHNASCVKDDLNSCIFQITCWGSDLRTIPIIPEEEESDHEWPWDVVFHDDDTWSYSDDIDIDDMDYVHLESEESESKLLDVVDFISKRVSYPGYRRSQSMRTTKVDIERDGDLAPPPVPPKDENMRRGESNISYLDTIPEEDEGLNVVGSRSAGAEGICTAGAQKVIECGIPASDQPAPNIVYAKGVQRQDEVGAKHSVASRKNCSAGAKTQMQELIDDVTQEIENWCC